MRKIGTGMQSIVARTALVLGIVATLCFTGAAWLIQKKAAEVQEATAMDELEQLARAEAAKVRGSTTETLSRVRGLADGTLSMMARGGAERGEASSLVRRFSETDPAVLGYWLELEPDAFDGRDAEFARAWKDGEPDAEALKTFVAGLTPSQQVSTDAGRMSVYWTRSASGEVSLQDAVGSENNIIVTGDAAEKYYAAVRQRGDELMFEPYSDEVDGKQVLKTSLMVPLKVDGQFRGVAG